MVEQGAAPAGVGKRTSRARAVPGPRPEALGPPARSSLMVRSPWLCPMLKGPLLRKGARLEGPSGRPIAARSAARLPEDAAVARREARRIAHPVCAHRARLFATCAHIRNGCASRRATPSIFSGERIKKLACPGPQTIRAMMHARCLKIESERRCGERAPIAPHTCWPPLM